MSHYKVQTVHQLLVVDRKTRQTYAQVIQNINEEEGFLSKNIISDKAHFHFSGYMNKQNNRFGGTQKGCITHKEPLNLLKVTAWCAVYAGGVIGLFFFENTADQTKIVDGARYRAMITDFFLSPLNELGRENMGFQQNAAMAHIARATADILKEAFPGRLISRFSDLHWPARSPSLTVSDLGGFGSEWFVRLLKPLREYLPRMREALSSGKSDEKCHRTGPYGHQLWRRQLGRYHFFYYFRIR